MRAAQDGRSAAGPACPWLPALPTLLTLGDLHASHGTSLAVGLVDLPEEQCQEPLVWDPAGGHWLLIGAPRSGRTTAALSIVRAATGHLGPDSLHVYAVDPSGGLGSIEDLPHTGTVMGADDLDLLDRLVDRLHVEVRRRTALPRGTAHPAILLVVDGWDRLGSEPLGSATDRLVALLREGSAVGLLAIVTGDRSLLLGPLGPLASTTLVLGLTDPVDAALAGLGRDTLPLDPPPGRAVRVRDGAEIQLAVSGTDGPRPVPGAAVGTPTGSAPIRLRRLPATVVLNDPAAQPPWTIGLGGDAAEPVTLDPAEVGRLLLVCGPRGSGRTTALAVLGRAALQTGRAIAVVEPRGRALIDYLTHTAGTPGRVTAATAYDIDDLVEARRRHPELVVLVDDADAVTGTPATPSCSRSAASSTGTTDSSSPPRRRRRCLPRSVGWPSRWPAVSGDSSSARPGRVMVPSSGCPGSAVCRVVPDVACSSPLGSRLRPRSPSHRAGRPDGDSRSQADETDDADERAEAGMAALDQSPGHREKQDAPHHRRGARPAVAVHPGPRHRPEPESGHEDENDRYHGSRRARAAPRASS